MMLEAGINNSTEMLQRAIPAYAAGKLAKPSDPHAIGVLYRQLGACRMLTEGVPEPMFVAQMQAAAAYLARLPMMSDAVKVTSRAAAFWDAIGGEYWRAASEIALHSRSTVNSSWEHEDDFLHVWFLMTRYFAARPEGVGAEAKKAFKARQRKLLDRWEVVLEGGYDPRWLLCDALLRADEQDFRTSLIAVADAREAHIKSQIDDGQMPEEHAVWYLPYWGEGLALLRLAELDGITMDDHVNMIPQILRKPNPYAYDGRAWGRIDFQPRLREK